MLRKRHKPEEIVAKRRQGDVLTAQGTPVADAVRSMGVTEVAPGRAPCLSSAPLHQQATLLEAKRSSPVGDG